MKKVQKITTIDSAVKVILSAKSKNGKKQIVKALNNLSIEQLPYRFKFFEAVCHENYAVINGVGHRVCIPSHFGTVVCEDFELKTFKERSYGYFQKATTYQAEVGYFITYNHINS
ncbi:MAG TPA: hypothetical protein PLB74_03450 [Candidatus Paceibacterota bacterium]|nr:hypothetical protein [Candidatus Paceibacterota bacterium]